MNIQKILLLALGFSGLLIATEAVSQVQPNDKDLETLLELSLEDLMNVEVTTATKTGVRIDLAPAIMEMVTSEQIRERGYDNLGQLLNDITGNHEDRSNWGIGEPLHQNVGFGFRFDTGQNILILFNGQRLNAFLPGNRFGGEEYLLQNIDRLEIIRGPGSAIYGTGAFTMVINIISKRITRPDEEHFQLRSQLIPTSRGHKFAGSLGTMVGRNGSLSGAFRYSKEGGQKLNVNNALFGNQVLNDGIDGAMDAELVYRNAAFNLYAKSTSQKRNTFTGFNSVSPANQDELKLSTYAYSIGSDYTLSLGSKTRLKMSGGWHQDNWTEVALIPQFKLNVDGSDLLYDPQGLPILDTLNLYRNGSYTSTSFFIDGQGADTRSIDGELQLTCNYKAGNSFTAGLYASDDKVLRAERPSELNLNPLEFVPFRVISDPANNWLFDTQASRQTIAGYAQMEQALGTHFKITLGSRLDHYSGTGILRSQNYTEFNPKGGLVFDANSSGTFKLLYGKATRIPNGFETLSAVAILGDPSNRPERMQMIQFQWIKNWSSNLRTEFGGFHAVISNRLITDADIPGTLKAQGYIGQFVNTQNPFNQQNNGLEVKANLRIKKAALMANITHYFKTNDGTGNALSYIAPTLFNLDCTVPMGWLSLNTGINYRSQFTKQITDPRTPVKSYLVARLNLNCTPSHSPLTFNLTVRNLFNTRYQYPSSSHDFVDHFPARGLEAVLGVACRLD